MGPQPGSQHPFACDASLYWRQVNEQMYHHAQTSHGNGFVAHQGQPEMPLCAFPPTEVPGFMQGLAKADACKRIQEFWLKRVPMIKLFRVEPVDEKYGGDPQHVAEYQSSILEHLKAEETRHWPNKDYMERQIDINPNMRGILVDWVIEVQMKFKMLPETLYLTINLIDRYLERTVIMRDRLQLVATAAMLIACKYEEIHPPCIADFVFITDNAFDVKEIIQMERHILVALEFQITVPSQYRFLERYAQIAGADKKLLHLAQLFMELTLLEQNLLAFTPSLVASSALYLAIKIIYKGYGIWSPTFVHYTGYQEAQLLNCAIDMIALRYHCESSKLHTVLKKFSMERFSNVSSLDYKNSTPWELFEMKREVRSQR